MRQLKSSSELACHLLAEPGEVFVACSPSDSQTLNDRYFHVQITGIALLIPLARLRGTETRESVRARRKSRGSARADFVGCQVAREDPIGFVAPFRTVCHVDRRRER